MEQKLKGVAWRVAQALLTLRDQVNAASPNRNKDWDGTIGDEAHQSRESDHNPWIVGPDGVHVVSGMDITNDPAHGVVSRDLAEMLLASKDKRVKYIIHDRTITAGLDGPSPFVKRPYGGSNPHDHHCHISVEDHADFYDNPAAWRFVLDAPAVVIDTPPAPPTGDTFPLLVLGAQGEAVKTVQRYLNAAISAKLTVDGDFGGKTERMVKQFQLEKGLRADGKVGPQTWAALKAAAAPKARAARTKLMKKLNADFAKRMTTRKAKLAKKKKTKR